MLLLFIIILLNVFFWMSSKKSLATTRRVEDSLSNTPCKTNEEILARQRECLRQTIVEAGKAEEKRLFALEIEKNSRRKQELSARFDEQRSRDQEKITRLQNDYLSLKNSIESGNVDFSHNIEERQNLTLKFTPANKNRFEGFDTQENIEFQKILTQKLEKYDKKFNNSVSSKPFDRQAEYRKVFYLCLLILFFSSYFQCCEIN